MSDHRWATVASVVAALRDCTDLAGVQVEPGFPGATHQAEVVYADVLDTAGDAEVPVTHGPDLALTIDDNWTLPLELRVSNRAGLDDTATRLGELAAAVTDTIRANADVGTEVGAGWFTVDLTVTRRTDAVAQTPQGYIGAARIELGIHSRRQES